MKVCHIHIEQMHIFLYICHMCGKISESLRLLTATANKVIFCFSAHRVIAIFTLSRDFLLWESKQ